MAFDYDLLTIGAGSGGVAATRRAGNYGARTAICEKDQVGGTCVLRGCIPKKLLVYASRFAEELEDSVQFGWSISDASMDWATLIKNKNLELERLNVIYKKLLSDANVDLIEGTATLLDSHTVEVGATRGPRRVTAETILLATGGWPVKPSISGLEPAMTSTEALDLLKLPEHLVILGGGYIAVEFAGIFSKLGVKVTEVIRADSVLRGFDEDIRCHLQKEMIRQDVSIRSGETVERVDSDHGVYHIRLSNGDVIEADGLLCAMGRTPNTWGLGLERVGVGVTENGAVRVDEWSRTSVPNIYAVGDCTDHVNLTPVAIAEGRALADTLYNNDPKNVDYKNIPSAIFSHPEVGTVGLTEKEARERFGEVKVYRSEFRPLKATISGNGGRTMMKLLVELETEKIIGCHMVGDGAAEIVQGLAIALKCGATKRQFDATMAIHPTTSEEFVTMYEPLLENAG